MSSASESPSVPVGSICCGLSSRGDGTFHWTLLFPIDITTAIKIHATNFQGPWEFEKTYQTLETSPSATICVVVKIGASAMQHHVSKRFLVFLCRRDVKQHLRIRVRVVASNSYGGSQCIQRLGKAIFLSCMGQGGMESHGRERHYQVL